MRTVWSLAPEAIRFGLTIYQFRELHILRYTLTKRD